MAYIVMAYMVMAFVVMAYMAMAFVVMAYMGMAFVGTEAPQIRAPKFSFFWQRTYAAEGVVQGNNYIGTTVLP